MNNRTASGSLERVELGCFECIQVMDGWFENLNEQVHFYHCIGVNIITILCLNPEVYIGNITNDTSMSRLPWKIVGWFMSHWDLKEHDGI